MVDVYVEGNIHGIYFMWIVECKAWNSNVPKEKVLALQSIITDVGADRGFLLSEKGFQSGALRIAEKANITLTSLYDLGQTIQTDSVIGRISWRVEKATLRLRKLKKDNFKNHYIPPMTAIMGELFILQNILGEALDHEYPIQYSHGQFLNSFEEFVKYADDILLRAESWTL
ncbi:restriction endonuclease [Dyadobacter sediminis]|uniref:Restriction endonuclease n=1 Tax=Dyadobacter sediminis TaxID=1493691 RepID=A0A5R9KG94_9BACT|nr:restriction endonuclease [Dyadobacter sediminis]TLU95157.1 restriction endonuclease [Dyadobacter sediminis]GGC16361.1 hypothetical protein GCM10011325_48910 [Dyadobacter sediminis]